MGLAVAVLASGWFAAAPAHGATTHTQTVLLKRSSVFTCSGLGGTNGFGTVRYAQQNTLLRAQYSLRNAPPSETLHVFIAQCTSTSGLPTEDDLGTVQTTSNGRAAGAAMTTLRPGVISWYICINDNSNEWGTDPIPVA
jgi:hypothetical protein